MGIPVKMDETGSNETILNDLTHQQFLDITQNFVNRYQNAYNSITANQMILDHCTELLNSMQCSILEFIDAEKTYLDIGTNLSEIRNLLLEIETLANSLDEDISKLGSHVHYV